jgi:hypothetical protein
LEEAFASVAVPDAAEGYLQGGYDEEIDINYPEEFGCGCAQAA